jgi:hypothetical protein
VLAGLVLAQASAGLVDATIRNDTNHLKLIQDWFGWPRCGRCSRPTRCVLRQGPAQGKAIDPDGRAAALTVFFQFLEHFAGSREPSPRNH